MIVLSRDLEIMATSNARLWCAIVVICVALGLFFEQTSAACITIDPTTVTYGPFNDDFHGTIIVIGPQVPLPDEAFLAGCAILSYPTGASASVRAQMGGLRYDVNITLGNRFTALRSPVSLYTGMSQTFINAPDTGTFCNDFWDPPNTGPDGIFCGTAGITGTCCYSPFTPQTTSPGNGVVVCSGNDITTFWNPNDNAVVNNAPGESSFCSTEYANGQTEAGFVWPGGGYVTFLQFMYCPAFNYQVYSFDVANVGPYMEFSYYVYSTNAGYSDTGVYSVSASSLQRGEPQVLTPTSSNPSSFMTGSVVILPFPESICSYPVDALSEDPSYYFVARQVGWTDDAFPSSPRKYNAGIIGTKNIFTTNGENILTPIGGSAMVNTPFYDSQMYENTGTNSVASGANCPLYVSGCPGLSDPDQSCYRQFYSAYGLGCTFDGLFYTDTGPGSCSMETSVQWSAGSSTQDPYSYYFNGGYVYMQPACDSASSFTTTINLIPLFSHLVCLSGSLTAPLQNSIVFYGYSETTVNVVATACVNSENDAGANMYLSVVCSQPSSFPALTTMIQFFEPSTCAQIILNVPHTVSTNTDPKVCTMYLANCMNVNIDSRQFTFESSGTVSSASVSINLPSIAAIGSPAAINFTYCQTAVTTIGVMFYANCTQDAIIPSNGIIQTGVQYVTGNACVDVVMQYSVPSTAIQQNVSCTIQSWENAGATFKTIATQNDAIMIIGCQQPAFVFQSAGGLPTTSINVTNGVLQAYFAVEVQDRTTATNMYSTVFVTLAGINSTLGVYHEIGAPILVQTSTYGSPPAGEFSVPVSEFDGYDHACLRLEPIAPCPTAGQFQAVYCYVIANAQPSHKVQNSVLVLAAVGAGIVLFIVGIILAIALSRVKNLKEKCDPKRTRDSCKRCSSRFRKARLQKAE